MYGMNTRGLPGTLAPIYQELQVERSEPPATSRMRDPVFLGLGLRLDAAEPLFAQIPNAIGHPFNVLLDRWQHVGQH